MATAAEIVPKERVISWDKGDDVKMFELSKTNIANPSTTQGLPNKLLEKVCPVGD